MTISPPENAFAAEAWTNKPSREENPAARWLARTGRGQSPWRPGALFFLPSLLWSAGLWAASRGGGRPADWAQTCLAAVPLPTLLVYASLGEWHFLRLAAKLRRSGDFEAFFVTGMTFREIVAGVDIAARRQAARGRLQLAAGALVPLVASFAKGRGALDFALAAIPASLALGWIVWRQKLLIDAPEKRLETLRPWTLSLTLTAARGPASAFFLLIVWILQQLCVVGLALGVLLMIGSSPGARHAWELLGAVAVLGAAFAVWCSRLASDAAAESDDSFGAALRDYLNRGLKRELEEYLSDKQRPG